MITRITSITCILIALTCFTAPAWAGSTEDAERKMARQEFTTGKGVGYGSTQLCRINNLRELMRLGNGSGTVWVGKVQPPNMPADIHLRGYLLGELVDISCKACVEKETRSVLEIKDWQIVSATKAADCDKWYVDEALKLLRRKNDKNR